MGTKPSGGVAGAIERHGARMMTYVAPAERVIAKACAWRGPVNTGSTSAVRSGGVPPVAMTCGVLVFAVAAVAARSTVAAQPIAPAEKARLHCQTLPRAALRSETLRRTGGPC